MSSANLALLATIWKLAASLIWGGWPPHSGAHPDAQPFGDQRGPVQALDLHRHAKGYEDAVARIVADVLHDEGSRTRLPTGTGSMKRSRSMP